MEKAVSSAFGAPLSGAWGNRAVCLCFHGYCASPATYLPLLERARAAGCDVFAPLLTGHGTASADLRDVPAEAWLSDACAAMEQMQQRYDVVHLVGHSLGGALATYVAGKYAATGRVGKVLLLVPGYALREKSFYEKDYSAYTDEKIPLVASAEVPPELRESAQTYDFMYLKSIGQLLRAGKLCEEQVLQVKAPVWLLYTNADPVVDPACCARAAAGFARLADCHVYEKTGHNLMADCERTHVWQRIEDFLRDDRA